MATIKDLAEQYGLEDYEQLLGGYPNATKFANALQSNIESHIPTTEDLQSPERMGEWSLAAALNQPTGLAIKGYHGSPHKFKEFDTAHMGSGEGGQAYGWGNYITEDPYVATTYSPQDEWMDEQLMNLYNQAERRQDYPSMEVYERYMMHERPNEVKDYLKESYADYPEDLPKRLPAQKIGENLYKKQKGSHLYEVSMEFPREREAVDPMSIEHFLDYDKPLSEQSDYVRNILQSHDPDMYHPEGPDYDPAEKGNSILQRFGSGKEGAQKLYELGIPGTTYMGEKSKVANPEGVRNFVTYSDEVPRVVTRNMNKVKPLTDEDRLNDLEKQMSAYMKTKRMPKGVDFKSGSDWYDWAYDKRAKLRGYAQGGEVKALHDKYEESDYGYGNRPDKTKKGLGYFGELERPDGTGVMTEYSIGVPINGKEMDVPTLVPTLTPDEIRLILHMQDGEDMPRSIVHKAIDHAHQRLSEGKPIFATEEDLYAHGGIVDVLHNDAIEQIMKAFMDSMADDEEPSAPAVSIEITTQNTETPRRGKIPKSIAREAKHG